MIIGVWAQFHLGMGPVTPLIYSLIICPVSVCIIEMLLPSSWQNPHNGSLIHEMWAIFGRKGHVEATSTASTFEKTDSPIKPAGTAETVPPEKGDISHYPHHIPIQLTFLASGKK